MKRIDSLLDEFLQAQSERVKQKTYRDYEGVILLFKDYLNSYAYSYLDEKETQVLEEKQDEEEAFTSSFGADKLTPEVFSDFLGFFILEKTAGSETFIKLAVRVMKKFTKWLNEAGYIDDEPTSDIREEIEEEGSEVSAVEKLSELISRYTETVPVRTYEELIEGYFSIQKIEKEALWLDEEMGMEADIGPVAVTKQIAAAAEYGWQLNLALGKYKGKWYIIESGNVYPF